MLDGKLVLVTGASRGIGKSIAKLFASHGANIAFTSLKRDEKVSIVGFGNFSVSHRKATTGRNPRTGESIQIPASKRPKFTVGKALKDAVNI